MILVKYSWCYAIKKLKQFENPLGRKLVFSKEWYDSEMMQNSPSQEKIANSRCNTLSIPVK